MIIIYFWDKKIHSGWSWLGQAESTWSSDYDDNYHYHYGYRYDF